MDPGRSQAAAASFARIFSVESSETGRARVLCVTAAGSARVCCYTLPMYARKFRVDVVTGGERRPCPLDWLDAFCMRNFTGSAEFDDTLPLGEGYMEASLKVDPERFAAAFAEWLTQRGKAAGQEVKIELHKA